jgi:excisionase family DNA binding protein
MSADFEDKLLTDQQVAEMAQVSVNTVRYWRQSGLIPFGKVGKHPRIWLSDFNKVFKKPDTLGTLRALGKEHHEST